MNYRFADHRFEVDKVLERARLTAGVGDSATTVTITHMRSGGPPRRCSPADATLSRHGSLGGQFGDRRPIISQPSHGPPSRGPGVRRLNRVPLFIAVAILAIIAATIAYTYWLRLQPARQVQTAGPTAKSVPVLMDAPAAGFIPPKASEAIPVLAPPPAPVQPAPPQPEPEDPNKAAWQRYLDRAERIRAAREQLALQAVELPTKLQVALAQPGASAPTERGG